MNTDWNKECDLLIEYLSWKVNFSPSIIFYEFKRDGILWHSQQPRSFEEWKSLNQHI